MKIPKPVANMLPLVAGLLLQILCSFLSYFGLLVAPFWFPPLLIAVGALVTILVTLSDIEHNKNSDQRKNEGRNEK